MSISAQKSTLSNRELRVAYEYRSLDSHGKRMIDLVLKEETARMASEPSSLANQYEIARERYGGVTLPSDLQEAE